MLKMSFTEKIIESVKLYPILYDTTNKDYKNTRKKDMVWDRIGTQLGQEGCFIKKKWRNVRDSFTKYIKSINSANGQGANIPNRYKNWQWARQMEWFKEYVNLTQTDNNIVGKLNRFKEATIDVKFSSHYLEDVLVNESNFQQNVESLFTHHQEDSKTSSIEQDSDYLENKSDKKYQDANELIFLGYAKLIKTFSPRRQAIAKMKIAKILAEEELRHLEEQSFDPLRIRFN